MIKNIKNFFFEILHEDGEWSLTRVIAFVGLAAFLIVSFYLAYKGLRWDNYETFATMTGGGGIGTQIANKFITSKWGTGDYSSHGDSHPDGE